jgi:hypothetical protein
VCGTILHRTVVVIAVAIAAPSFRIMLERGRRLDNPWDTAANAEIALERAEAVRSLDPAMSAALVGIVRPYATSLPLRTLSVFPALRVVRATGNIRHTGRS